MKCIFDLKYFQLMMSLSGCNPLICQERSVLSEFCIRTVMVLDIEELEALEFVLLFLSLIHSIA